MLHEISRLSISTNKNEEPRISWCNSVLSVSTEKGMQLFDFAYNLESLDKNIDLKVSIIPTPKSSPAKGLFPKKFLQHCLTNEDITQMVLEPGLWPHNTQLTTEMANIVTYDWSPVGMLHGNDCIIAILNNVGHVEMFGPENHKWTSVLDLSDVINTLYLPTLNSKAIGNLEDLRNIVNVVETCSILWGPKVDEHICYFITAQKNNKILIWLLQSHGTEIKTELKAEIQTEIGEIVSMLWIPKTDSKFLFICSNDYGQIFGLDFQMIKNHIELVNTTCLWEHKDRMIAKHLRHTIIDDKILLLYNKHRHLFVQVLNDECKIISQFIKNINDYRITDFVNSTDGVYLATANCKIYKIDLNIVDGQLDVKLSQIGTKEVYETYDLYSLIVSSNSVIWAAAMADRAMQCRKYPAKIDLVFFCTDPQNHTETVILLENPAKRLTNYWDCIELLRCKILKLRALPSIDYVQLYSEANTDPYKMKVYHLFVVLYNLLENIIQNSSRGVLPETSIEVVREKICANQAVTLIQNLHQNGSDIINNFDIECYNGAKKYLEYYCQKYKRSPSEFIPTSFLHLTKMVPLYICQGCEEIIDRFTCRNEHYNMFCSLTFTPIQNDYMACKSCNSTARLELRGTRPVCLFCELYLSYFHEPEI